MAAGVLIQIIPGAAGTDGIPRAAAFQTKPCQPTATLLPPAFLD